MVESDIYTMLESNLDSAIEISWGKIDPKIDWSSGVVSVDFFKLPSQSSDTVPCFLDNFQLSVRSQYIDTAQQTANDIIEMFHLFSGKITTYRIWVTNVYCNGGLYEDNDIVHIPITLSIKYTGI